ncbi:hypothetical protein M433DRAFT_387381 [Acidomyces richmondensis BFW]|nr:MAG: hypothetical protein FE78DRAFT_234041 [Acidomyces sp. 'richmondensis']KYG42843.1 hypothetical protein M433DRAFT_387381 [Acidomyces richmondensis BFW]
MQVPGSFRRQGDESPNTTDKDEGEYSSGRFSDQPGKFAKIKDFMMTSGTQTHQLIYYRAHNFHTQLGDIIYTQADDDKNQIHNRVMLVVRCNKLGMTCLSFCRYDEEQRMLPGHWIVRSTQEEMQDHTKEREHKVLYITLKKGTVREGMTININEPWNVENDQNSVAILGHVMDKEFNKLACEAVRLYALGMGIEVQADKRARSTSQPQAKASGKDGNGAWTEVPIPGDRGKKATKDTKRRTTREQPKFRTSSRHYDKRAQENLDSEA